MYFSVHCLLLLSLWKRSVRLVNTLLPSRLRESQSEKILQGITSYTGKVRGLAPSHLFIPTHCLQEAGPAFNVPDKNWRSLKIRGVGTSEQLGKIGWAKGPLTSRFIVDFILLSSETPWKIFNVVVYVLSCSYIHSSQLLLSTHFVSGTLKYLKALCGEWFKRTELWPTENQWGSRQRYSKVDISGSGI